MPRLRYLKNYNADFEEKNEDNSQNREWTSGESWLSNNAVIASMPDNKLKEAMAYYKILVSRLEQELWLRSRKQREFTNLAKPLNKYSTNSAVTSRGKKKIRQPSRNSGIFKGLTLSKELKSALLKILKES